jgi:penicillin amidase
MPASPVSQLRTPARHLWRWLAVAVIAAAVLVFLGAGAWLYAASRASLPQLDGEAKVSGLTARAIVTRDVQGVPHIAAGTLEDLFFAQGYVNAQDRLWQMDMSRRYAAGELAEILGRRYLEHDRQQRTLLIRPMAEKAAARLSPRDRTFFEAYARGVNAYIADQKRLPIEFRILRYRPRPWAASDSFLVAANMVQMLTLQPLTFELSREKIRARLSPELAADLFPNSSWRDRLPADSSRPDEFVPSNGEDEEQEEEQPPPHKPVSRYSFPVEAGNEKQVAGSGVGHQSLQGVDSDALVPGSNNWTLSGAHTVSGKPLLSNDMHLEHHLPNVWYEAHLASGGFDVAGVTLPGVPFVVVGHNQRVAWGFTNIGPAVSDLYVETFNDRGEYRTPDGWRQPEHHRETIHVRDGADEILDVLITRHGPIVSGLQPGETRQLALKWTAYDPEALRIPLFDMDSAQNWEQFRDALRRFTSPAQNVVYADVDGHIAYQATGMIPLRSGGDGSFPVAGDDDAHEWRGYIPFEQLPNILDPPSGIIATANGRIVPASYPYVISNEWGAPYRTERIYHVLRSGRKLGPADLLKLQTDIYSEFDRFCGQRFVYAVDHAAKASARARQAADLMRDWDGQVSAGSVAPTLISHSRRELVRLLLEPKLGELWREYRWFMSSVWLENVLQRQPARWLPVAYSRWDDLLAAAVEAAVSREHAPAKLADWRWGRDQTLEISHPLFGMVPLLRRWAGTGRVPQSGDGYTVKQVGRNFGPSERMTVDLANLDNSTLNIVNGQSGQFSSPYYMNQWRAWYGGTTFLLPYSSQAVEQAKRHVLVLKP